MPQKSPSVPEREDRGEEKQLRCLFVSRKVLPLIRLSCTRGDATSWDLEVCEEGAHLGFQCMAGGALEGGKHTELTLTKGKSLFAHFQCFLTLETEVNQLVF